MPEVDPGFSVKKPVSVWNRPLKVDVKRPALLVVEYD